MSDIQAKIEKFCREHFNEIVLLYDTEMVRLIGFGVGADDIYYIIRNQRGKVIWCSAVGHCESLKGILPKYDRTDELFEMNHCPKEVEFMLRKDPPEKAFPVEVIERFAKAWASIDGKLAQFEAEKGMDMFSDGNTGSYEGYMSEARELLRRANCEVVINDQT